MRKQQCSASSNAGFQINLPLLSLTKGKRVDSADLGGLGGEGQDGEENWPRLETQSSGGRREGSWDEFTYYLLSISRSKGHDQSVLVS